MRTYSTRLRSLVHYTGLDATVTYPYGQDYLTGLVPLTASQVVDLELWLLNGRIAASERKAARVDRAIVWLFGAALVCLYAGLDYGLSSWLLRF